jgi:hypothetical protein
MFYTLPLKITGRKECDRKEMFVTPPPFELGGVPKMIGMNI